MAGRITSQLCVRRLITLIATRHGCDRLDDAISLFAKTWATCHVQCRRSSTRQLGYVGIDEKRDAGQGREPTQEYGDPSQQGWNAGPLVRATMGRTTIFRHFAELRQRVNRPENIDSANRARRSACFPSLASTREAGLPPAGRRADHLDTCAICLAGRSRHSMCEPHRFPTGKATAR